MPLLFSYGSLQREDVQLATFGRRLEGDADALPGYEPTLVPIADPRMVAATGRTHDQNAAFTGNAAHRVSGMAFAIAERELARVDAYEAPSAYRRVEVTLASGRQAWVYVHAPHWRPPDAVL